MFCKINIFKNFANFLGKHLFWSLFNKIVIIKRLEDRCFAEKFAKFLRTTFFTKHLRWLLLVHARFLCGWLIILFFLFTSQATKWAEFLIMCCILTHSLLKRSLSKISNVALKSSVSAAKLWLIWLHQRIVHSHSRTIVQSYLWKNTVHLITWNSLKWILLEPTEDFFFDFYWQDIKLRM